MALEEGPETRLRCLRSSARELDERLQFEVGHRYLDLPTIAELGEHADASSTDAGDRFEFPWSTSFEDGFCGYFEGNGSCYTTGSSASYKIVESPVRTGRYAAAFTVMAADGSDPGTNSRCHRYGDWPVQAYYGAWYYIPAVNTNTGLWNLFHFQGTSTPGTDLKPLWDISLTNNDSGGLRLAVFNFNGTSPDTSKAPAIPIGRWFHIVMYLKLASDDTGEVSVSQDGASIASYTGITDLKTPLTFGDWYVGNLATDLSSAQETLYVDDVSVGDTP